MRWLRSSLGFRLVIPVIIALVPFVAFTQQTLFDNRDQAVDDARNAIHAVAVSTELSERLVLRAAEELLVALASDPIVGAGGPACTELISQVSALESRYANLGFADTAGNATCSAVPLARPTNIGDRSYFQDALSSQRAAVGVYQIGRATGVASLNIGHPVFDSAGQPLGVVFAAIDLNYLTAQMTDVSLPAGAVLLALDATGTVLVTTSDVAAVGDQLLRSSLDELLLEPERLLRSIVGEEVVASSVALNAQGVLAIAVPRRLVVAGVETQYRTGLFVTLVAGAIGGGLAFAFAFWSVIRPVERIRAGVARIAAGDLTARLDPGDPRGTLGSLSHDIDVMAASMGAHEAALRAQAFRDPLTGLPNRAGLLQELAELQASARPFLLIYARIVEFRGIAATLGYAAGDEIVMEAARRLGAESWPEMVARVSDTAFVVVARTGDEASEDARWGMARVTALLARRFTVSGVGLSVEIGTGAAIWPDHADDLDLLLRHSEAAARAPRREEVGTLYDPRYDGEATANVHILSELHRALEEGDLRLAYQPVVQLDGGATRRFEALLRWTTPEGEIRPPADFIPLAERAGLVGEMDRWVMRTALTQLGKWRRTHGDVSVSVNVSGPTLQDERFPDFVERLLREHSVPPQALTVEITETSLVSYVGRARATCERFAGMGILISVDDFGMGHSPVVYLREFPISALKIDQSLVRDLGLTPVRRIVEALTRLGRELGLEVVAEGVETDAMRTGAMAAGCTLAQGFLFSAALEVEAVQDWIEAEASGRPGPSPRANP